MRVSHQTVTRCLQRAAELGVLAALDDRARTGREATITAEARTWLVGLACAKPTQCGHPHAVKPHKVRYYLERRDPEFEPKMAEVLCVYRQVEMRRAAGRSRARGCLLRRETS